MPKKPDVPDNLEDLIKEEIKETERLRDLQPIPPSSAILNYATSIISYMEHQEKDDERFRLYEMLKEKNKEGREYVKKHTKPETV